MHFEATPIADARVIEPSPKEDFRGRFMRAWCRTEFAYDGIDFNPAQANMALSLKRGTIRGLHFQVAPALEAKLVRCTRGEIFDVVVDLRPNSPTYGHWFGSNLSAENGRMLYVPEGCAHGCQSLEDLTEIYYLTSTAFSPEHARGFRYDDPAFGIKWPLAASAVSDQDLAWPVFSQSARRPNEERA